MSKYKYRLWIGGMNIGGNDFNKLSEALQDEIETMLQSYTIPMAIIIDASIPDTILLKIGSSRSVEFDKETREAFTKWFAALDYARFGANYVVELWRDLKEEE
jgi:hypothetical protein